MGKHRLVGQREAGQGRNEKEGDTKLPVKTKIRETDRATQFCSAGVKQTQSSKLFPLRFKILCKTQRKPGYLHPAPFAI